jgi:DNA-binding NarL/FixJ family response regulator
MSSILLVEDHAILGKALVRLLIEKANQEVVAVLGSAEEVIEQIGDLQGVVDLALVDVSLPKMNGIQLVSYLHEHYPNLPCLVITGHLIPFYLQRSIEAGARGYVLKDDVAGILEGVQTVLQGGTYVSKALRD